jgi:hypothetical protein
MQCDLTRSGCIKCSKLGKTCPGYRQEQDLLFHNKNIASYATKLAHDHRMKYRRYASSTPGDNRRSNSCLLASPGKGSPVSGLVAAELSHAESDDGRQPGELPQMQYLQYNEAPKNMEPESLLRIHCGTSAADIDSFSISPRIEDRWSTHSVRLLLNLYSVPLDGSRFYGYLDFLPDLYRETSEESCLSLTTNAFTRAYIANQAHTSAGTDKLAELYWKALRSTNAALRDPSKCVQDDTIMAVWLLGIHEVKNEHITFYLYN